LHPGDTEARATVSVPIPWRCGGAFDPVQARRVARPPEVGIMDRACAYAGPVWFCYSKKAAFTL